jgi:WD40 repeat protein
MQRRTPRFARTGFGLSAACLVLAGALHAAPAAAPTDVHGDSLPVGALARLGTARLRHGADVTFVAFVPGGKTLVTAGQDNTIRVWDLESGREIRRFSRPAPAAQRLPGKGDKPNADEQAAAALQMMMGGGGRGNDFNVALAPDGKTLAATGRNVVQLWEVATGKELRRIEGPGGLTGLLFSPDGRTLAGRAGDGTLFLWAADTGKEVHHIKPAPRPQGNGIVLILGGDDDPDPAGMAFTPDGKALVATATDYKGEEALHSVKFWDATSGKEIRRIKIDGDGGASVVAVAPGGKLVAYGRGNTVHLCEAESGKEVRQVKGPEGGIQALVFSPDGKTLAVRGRGQRVRLYETETGKEQRKLGDPAPDRRGGGLAALLPGVSAPEARAVAISPDGKQVAAAAGSTVRVWETATGKELPLLEGHRRAPSAVVLSPDGKTAVSWGADRVVRRWEAATGKALGSFAAPAGTTLATFSADGRLIGLANADNTIRVHDTVGGKELHQLKGAQGGVAALAFSPDGKVLAARGTNDNTVRLYDLAKNAEVRQVALAPPNNPGGGGAVFILGGGGRAPRGTGPGLAFSPDGRLLVANAPGGEAFSSALVVIDVAAAKELRKVESPKPIASFAFSPDGRVLATESEDRTIILWEVASGKERGRLGKPSDDAPQANGGGMMFRVVIDGFNGDESSEPAGPVGVCFSPDGRAVAARAPGQSVRVWDVAAGKEVGQFKGNGGRVETIAFARDGKALASSSADTTVVMWDTAGALKALSKPAAADLTAAELETAWRGLSGEDGAKALRAVQKLAAAPRQAVPSLTGRIKPEVRVDAKKIDGWIADLDSEKFAVREAASANLLKAGDQAVPVLRKVLASGPPLETRKRVEDLLDRLTGGTLAPEQLQVVRAVEALERMGTPEAGRLLRTLADGAPGALTTREAQAALDRLAAPRP